jgi:hypothetical protein
MEKIQVVNCVERGCKQKAIDYTGHIHDGEQIIDAGFCKEHSARSYNPKYRLDPVKNCKMQTGCFGKWLKKYGKESY